MTVGPPPVSWALWFQWAAVNTLGFSLASTFVGVAMATFEPRPCHDIDCLVNVALLLVHAILGGIVGAALVGVMQWVVLRRQLSRVGWWVLATTVGLALGTVAALFAGASGQRGIPFPASLAPFGALIGAVVGLMQWRILRRQVARAGWWVLASGVAFSLGLSTLAVWMGLSGTTVEGRSVRGNEVLLIVSFAAWGGAVGTAVGASTGATLIWLLRRPLLEE